MVKQHEQHRHWIFRQLRVVALAALYVGCPTWVGVQADDTQIYVNKVPGAQTPNVLFSIDTSGSMDSLVSGGSQTRIEAVKDALTGLINNTPDLKAGLGRFHYELGGPIIFPVVNLDAAPDFLNDTQSVSSIDRISDDAEEVTSTGVVDVDDPLLDMTLASTLSPANPPTTVLATPSSGTDDDEAGTSGATGINSPDIDMGQEDAGIRFTSVAVPQGSIIAHAEVEFIAADTQTNDTNVRIWGHDVDDSPTFTETGADSVSNRAGDLTSARVPWSNIDTPAAIGDKITTPNIRSVVQEIVNRGGWADGNAMTILFQALGGHLELSSFDDPGNEAVLRVSYIDPSATIVQAQVEQRRDDAEEDGGNLDWNDAEIGLMEDDDEESDYVGFIFSDVQIPTGAVAIWADIQFTIRDEVEGDKSDMEIYGILESDPGWFTNGNDISDRPLTDGNTALSSDGVVEWFAGYPTIAAGEPGTEEIFTPDDGEPLLTPNLAELINEILLETSFTSGDQMGFVFRDAAGDGDANREICSFDGVNFGAGCPEPVQFRPTLNIAYGTPEASDVNQQVGLRFNNVLVPQGATIESAHLEFTVGGETTEPGSLTIEAENNTSPVSYSNNSGEKISDRSYTGSVAWNTDAWDTIGEIKQSPDISSLVSAVTDQGGWCGGGSLAFRITSTDARLLAQSFDQGGSGAPTLRVQYNTDSLASGEGCTAKKTTVSVADEDGDVEEYDSSGFIDFNSGDLDIESGVLVGLRFENVQVPAGATITGTNLYLTADEFDSGGASIVIQAQQHPNAPPFSDANGDVSSRISTGDPSVTWNESTDWFEDGIYSPGDDGVDLTPLIASIIDGTVTDGTETWSAGNALVFMLDGQNSSDRDADVCCGSDPPARLEISYEVNLGDNPDLGKVTGREAVLGIIDDLVASGFTPPVDALLEGAYYWNSEPVHFGRTRGAGMSYESSGTTTDGDLDSQIAGHTDAELLVEGELSRLSHYATYDPQTATIVREGDCTALNPNDPDCATEHIDNSESPVYQSPFLTAEECEKGFLVLLSDGIANRNSSRDLIQNLTGRADCPLDIPQIDSAGDAIINSGAFSFRDPTSDELCGLELAEWLHLRDFIDEPDNPADVLNNVRTFTIGFNLDINDSTSNQRAVEFLKALAFVGNGGDLSDPDGVDGVQYGDGFYTANTADELQDVFEVIVNEIIQETTSFVAPGNSINSFNRLFNLDDIYYALFRPDDTVAWLGNLKKFKLCTDQPGCVLGETIDRNGDPAVNTNANDLETFGALKTDALGFWSTTGDSAPEIAQGGAGELIPTYQQRNVYVNTDGGTVPAPDYVNDDVTVQGTAPHKIDLDSDVGPAPASNDPADFNDLKTALRNEGNCDSGTLDDQNACLNDLIEWLTGKRFPGDLPRDGTDEDVDRWAFGDPMHSRPLVMTYGRDPRDVSDPDDDAPLSKLFVGTNDGGIRMINEGDGVEEWIYYPYSMLGMQSELKDNPNDTHLYGIDDSPTARVRNADSDSVIEPTDGDFVHLFFGLRRGGRQVFAVNVTPESTVGLASSTTYNQGTDVEFTVSVGEKGKVMPELLWRIDGTNNQFSRLGLAWSTPKPAQIQGPDGPRSVVIFGGGYSTEQDGEDTDGTSPDGGDVYNNASSGDSMGNAIFIVDANTGERLWWASSSNDGNGDPADAVVSSMNTSIPAPLTLLDTTNDGLIDRLYAVDLRGQVFRVDLALEPSPDPGESILANSSVGVLARLGSDATNADRRKFFYEPEVARVNDTAIVEAEYELINVVSGNRAEPLTKTVQDRAYAIRDFLVDNPPGGLNNPTPYPACNPTGAGCTPGVPLTNSNLTDVTESDAFVIRDDSDGPITLLGSDSSELGSSDQAVSNLKTSHGWYFDLKGQFVGDPTATELSGEKGFSSGTALGSVLSFTTFIPPDETADPSNACSVPETLGTSRIYQVDFFTGAPAFDRNDDLSFDEVERFESLGAGPSAEYVPIFDDAGTTGIASTGGGSVPVDPGLDNTLNKTFWVEEQ